MDDPETKALLREIRDLQKAQLQLFQDWQDAVSGRQQEMIADAETWRKDHLAWQKKQVWSNRVVTALLALFMVCWGTMLAAAWWSK